MTGNPAQVLTQPFDLLLYPNICQICKSSGCNHGDGYVCRRCQKEVKKISKPWCTKCGAPHVDTQGPALCCDNCINMKFTKARSLFVAQGLPRKIIHQLKYHQHEYFEPLIRKWLCNIFTLGLNLKPDAIIPVPLHPIKERDRGINQAESIAQILSQCINTPVCSRLLKRTRATESQTNLTKTKRMTNTKNAFACVENALNGHFLIVDDVLTTGATASECAETILNNGAASAEVFTITRGGFL